MYISADLSMFITTSTEMGKLITTVFALLVFGFALTCEATTYIVGDTSGWDISTDLDTWAKDKTFVVGDVLLFQYSSSHSVNEVDKDSYDGCDTTNVLQSRSNGNTSYPLTNPGDSYFICGNKLHCYAGMKLHVVVQEKQAAAPAGALEAESGGASLPNTNNPSSKTNNPSSVVPSSAMFTRVGLGLIFLSFLIILGT